MRNALNPSAARLGHAARTAWSKRLALAIQGSSSRIILRRMQLIKTLRFMNWVNNAHRRIELPYNCLSSKRTRATFPLFL